MILYLIHNCDRHLKEESIRTYSYLNIRGAILWQLKKMDDSLSNSHLYSIQCCANGYSSMQIRKFSLFIQISRTPLHDTARMFNGCSSPRGTREGRQGRKEMQGGRLVWASESRGWLQTYDPIGKSNIRRVPHRDIHSLLCILLTITFSGCLHFRVFYLIP